MIEEFGLRNALMEALKESFAPQIPVEEGVIPVSVPGLAVVQSKMEQLPQGSGRVQRTYHYRIAYHPDQQSASLWEDLALAQQALGECLQRVAMEGRIVQAAKIRCFVRDNTLFCRAEYPVAMRSESARPTPMRELEMTENYKEE